MTRQETIDRIRLLAPTASAAFLMRFDEMSLSDYHKRLSTLAGRRGRDTVWTRPASTTTTALRRVA